MATVDYSMGWILWQQSNFILLDHLSRNCVSCPLTLSSCVTQDGLNTDSGHFNCEAHFDGISKFTVDNKFLHPRTAEWSVTY